MSHPEDEYSPYDPVDYEQFETLDDEVEAEAINDMEESLSGHGMSLPLGMLLQGVSSFHWKPGILAVECTNNLSEASHVVRQVGFKIENQIQAGGEFIPVIEDPATRGCIMAMVRRLGYPRAHSRPNEGNWTVYTDSPDEGGFALANGTSEAEAIAAALLSAHLTKEKEEKAVDPIVRKKS